MHSQRSVGVCAGDCTGYGAGGRAGEAVSAVLLRRCGGGHSFTGDDVVFSVELWARRDATGGGCGALHAGCAAQNCGAGWRVLCGAAGWRARSILSSRIGGLGK